jgi:hypothetical protein
MSMKTRILFLLSALMISAVAQDFAPESVVDSVYAVRPLSGVPFAQLLPHSGVLAAGGVRVPVIVVGVPTPVTTGTYAWTKTGRNTGTLMVDDATGASRLDVVFNGPNVGTYRESSVRTTNVIAGNIFFSPLPNDPSPPLTNLSLRTTLAAGQLATAGFVVSGGPRKVLVRAIGPALAQFGVANPAANPSLTVFKTSTVLATNTGWGGTPALTAAFGAVGAFALPANSADCAVLLTLEPGDYTAQAKASGPGDVLVEVYFVN